MQNNNLSNPSQAASNPTLHEIFNGTGPATFTDVINGYGAERVLKYAERYLGDNVMFPELDTLAKAEVYTWVHLRGVIDHQRKLAAKTAQREADYTGDRSSPSPLNPFRTSNDGGDYPREFDGTQRDRDNYDITNS